MSANVPTHPTSTGAAGAGDFCVLLACFEGTSGASKARRGIDALVKEEGGVVLDAVVLRVDAKHKARVFDPRRTRVGLLTSALTWGIFGLVTGGWASLGLWALLGALGGGAWAYFTEHVLTKDELARVGHSMPPNSSALAVYLQVPDPQHLVTRTESLRPTTATIAAIATDLSVEVHSAAAHQSSTGQSTAPADQLAMLLVRFDGKKASHDALQLNASTKKAHASKAHASAGGGVHQPQVELLIETDGSGKRRVLDPTTGARTTSRGDMTSWGAFGVVWGAIAGYLGTSGIFGSVEKGITTGIGYAIFGLIAGALYGLWVGRGVSARRLKRMGPILPPNSSTVIAWADSAVGPADITTWSVGSSKQLTLWFTPTASGAELKA